MRGYYSRLCLGKSAKPSGKMMELDAKKFLETKTEKQREQIFAALKIATKEGNRIRRLTNALREVAEYLKKRKK